MHLVLCLRGGPKGGGKGKGGGGKGGGGKGKGGGGNWGKPKGSSGGPQYKGMDGKGAKCTHSPGIACSCRDRV